MALIPADLADKIKNDMSFGGATSTQLVGWATGVIDEIQAAAIINNAAGTITGVCPPSGGPLIAGEGTSGIISGMDGSNMATRVKNEAGYPSVSSQLTTFCTEIVDHIHNSGSVDFASGNITGVCTNTLLTPGVLTAGAGTDGVISGLDGTALATSIHNAIGYPGGVSPKLIEFCTAFTDYVMSEGVCEYVAGGVTGTCPMGGGALLAGTGVSGTIS